MAYTVLARKYRPQTFDELVGQEHVARTLSNAIAQDRVAHAFLFTGVRGVGKTTTARLLAKALNCEQGPTPTPCNECGPCKDITGGVDIDVLEIDGASNNSVDDVRRLQETLPYRPARDRFKVVIVDEVHMLSQGAFNAFLKTLEEPPAHVKFIFATTEAHKVPITIRSRCQRYDFRLIPQAVVAARVQEILQNEGIGADDAAVALVAREAAGSMRDALTLLDQLVAFGGERLVGEEVAQTLGVADRRHVLEAARAMLEGDGAAALRTVDSLATQGADMLHFVRQLLSLVRDLVVLRVAGDDGELVDLVPEEREAARALAGSIDLHELQRAFAALSRLVDDVARASAPKTVLEMGLVRIATRPPLRGVTELLERLESLERRLGGGGGGRGGGRPRPSPPDRPAPPARSRGRASGARPVEARSGEAGEQPEAAARAGADTGGKAATGTAAEGDGGAAAPTAGAPVVSPAGTPAELWEQVVSRMRESAPALAAILEHAAPMEMGPERVVLGFSNAFHQRQADAAEAREAVGAAAGEVLGRVPQVRVQRLDAGAAAETATVAQRTEQRREEERQRVRQQALSHPRVQDAMQIFPESADHVQVRIED
ncbi:MAG: DNA polymerase III subunit gamma/tau [Myxococcota bacterium]